jgi:hypothetical protein
LVELAEKYAEDHEPLIVVIDALDQLYPDENRDNRIFCPSGLKGHVRFLITCTPDIKIGLAANTVLDDLCEKDRNLVIHSALSRRGKDISEEIAGVFEDYKHRDYNQPLPLVVRFKKELAETFGFLEYAIVLRLKEGVDAKAFESRFMKEVAPQLKQGNYYLNRLRTFEEVGESFAKDQGIHIKLNTQFSLAAFALLCIFLGTLGTFWVRCDDRRQDIGLMRSLGASKTTIVRQFFVETGLLVTLAFVCALPLLMHYVHENGMYYAVVAGEPKDSLAVWWLETVPHFCMVSLLTYVILLFIALLGTYIPVSRAVNVLPSDALRDE